MQKPKIIPAKPGVYIFRDKRGKRLYIGKAANLRLRVPFYFRKEIHNQPRLRKLMEEASSLTFQKTESDIEALILETSLIKKFLPKYNVLMRDDKNYLFVVITREAFPKIISTHQPKSFPNAKKIIGPFTDAGAVKETLRILRRIFPYCTCPSPHRGFCTNAEIGKCPGFCCSKGFRASRVDQNQYAKNVSGIVSILEGRKIGAMLAEYRRRLYTAARQERYEEAARYRDRIFGLESLIEHRPVHNKEAFSEPAKWEKTMREIQRLLQINKRIKRAEAYDISNISGTAATGSMVVFRNGVPDKGEYRKFRIKTVEGANDVAMMAEVLVRRMRHHEWRTPDLIVLDGGKPQLNAVLKALATFHFPHSRFQTIITALAKRDEELYVAGRPHPIPLKRTSKEVLHFFQWIRDEAHRFAKKYHHTLRGREMKMG